MLDSFCIHSPAHAFLYFPREALLLGTPFLYCGVHSFLSMLSLARVQLLIAMSLSSLMIWYSGLTALFLFFLANAALAYLPTALAVALRPLFPSQQVQYAQVSLLKPAPFCKVFAGLSSTIKSAPSLLSSYLSFCLSHPILSLIFPFTSNSGKSCLLSPPVLSGYNGSPDTGFSWETMWLMSWPDWECYLHPPQSLVVSLLLSRISTLLFSWTGGVLSHRNSSTHRFPRFPLRNLCSLLTLAVFSLVYTATDSAYCLALISSGLAELRILPAVLMDTCPRSLLISFCTVQLLALCATRSLRHCKEILCLSTISGPGPEE